MTDTVTRLMELADDYMMQEREGINGYEARQALQDELTKLFTPLSADAITKHIQEMDIDVREDLCAFSFRSGARWAEQAHGITGGKE